MDLGGVVVNQELEETQSLKYSDFSLAELWEAPIGWAVTKVVSLPVQIQGMTMVCVE